MALERLERVPAGLLVTGGIEVEAVARPEPPVPVWAEVRPRLGQREVDVEHHCAEHAATIARVTRTWFGRRPNQVRACVVSGCGDLNSGPLRPERSALPGCATPRDRHRLAEEFQRSPGARVRPLGDQEMAAVGDHPDRCTQSAGILEPVLERNLAVARAPEHEHGAANAVEVLSRVVGASARPAPIASVCIVGPRSSPCTDALAEQLGVRDLEGAEDQTAQAPGARNASGAPSGETSRLHDPDQRDRDLREPRRARDARRGSEHEPPHQLGPALGKTQSDRRRRVSARTHRPARRPAGRRRPRRRRPPGSGRPAAEIEAAWPGRSGISSLRPGSSGASSLKFQAAPP